MNTPADRPSFGLPPWAWMLRPSRTVVIAALIAGVLAAGLVAAYILQTPPRYESLAVLIIDQPSQIAGGTGEGVISKLNQLRVKYSVLARTRRLTDPVAMRLKLPVSTVARSIRVALPGPSLVMVVSARTGSRKHAQQIANEMATELINFVKAEMEAAKVPDDKRIVFSLVAPAQPGIRVEPTTDRALYDGMVGGVVAAVAVLVVFQLVRLSRKTRT